MKLTTRPLTPDLWLAFEDLFRENGAAGGCWCMYWRIGRAYRLRGVRDAPNSSPPGPVNRRSAC
jgi:hypothetical protein